MSGLLILLSTLGTLGGVALLGALGLNLGPMLAAVLMNVLANAHWFLPFCGMSIASDDPPYDA